MTFFDRWWLVRAGLLGIAFGSGPLLLIVLLAKLGVTSDPNPNPVAFGILAMLTFWPSVLATLAGVFLARARRRK
jgi:hypothetical protein